MLLNSLVKECNSPTRSHSVLQCQLRKWNSAATWTNIYRELDVDNTQNYDGHYFSHLALLGCESWPCLLREAEDHLWPIGRYGTGILSFALFIIQSGRPLHSTWLLVVLTTMPFRVAHIHNTYLYFHFRTYIWPLPFTSNLFANIFGWHSLAQNIRWSEIPEITGQQIFG